MTFRVEVFHWSPKTAAFAPSQHGPMFYGKGCGVSSASTSGALSRSRSPLRNLGLHCTRSKAEPRNKTSTVSARHLEELLSSTFFFGRRHGRFTTRHQTIALPAGAELEDGMASQVFSQGRNWGVAILSGMALLKSRLIGRIQGHLKTD